MGTRTCTLTPLVNSLSEALRAMLALRGAKSMGIHMEVGVRTEGVLSQARIQLRWIVLLRTSAVKWQNRSSKADWPSVPWYSFRMPLELRNLCRSLWRLMVPNAASSPPMTLPMSSRSNSIVAQDLSKYAGMDSAQVTTALKASNYLTKWVD